MYMLTRDSVEGEENPFELAFACSIKCENRKRNSVTGVSEMFAIAKS